MVDVLSALAHAVALAAPAWLRRALSLPRSQRPLSDMEWAVLARFVLTIGVMVLFGAAIAIVNRRARRALIAARRDVRARPAGEGGAPGDGGDALDFLGGGVDGGGAAAEQHGSSSSSSSRGRRTVTVSADGVLIRRASGGDDVYEPIPGALDAAAALFRGAQLHVLMRVDTDDEEAAARAALRRLGLFETGLLAEHRAVFHSTVMGAASIVRQIAPQQHYESHPDVVAEVQKHVPGVVYIEVPGSGVPPRHGPRVYVVDSLATWRAAQQ